MQENHRAVNTITSKLPLIILLAFLLVFTLYGWLSHINLQTSLFDLGLQEQVIWNTSEGRWFQSSPEVDNYLGDHFSPLLIIVSLVYKLIPGTLTLFVLQSLAVTLGILAFYKLALRKLSNNWFRWLALLGMISFWPLGSALLFDFHEIVLAFPFLAWGIYLLETDYPKRKWLALALLLLAMMAKEDVGIFVACLGAFYIIFKKKFWAVLLVITGLIWSSMSLFVLIPFFRQGEVSDTLSRYGYFQLIFSNPQEFIKEIVSVAKLKYIAKVFLPFPLLFAIIPQATILVVPVFLINILSAYEPMFSGTVHYDILLSTGLFLAAFLLTKNWKSCW